jgi:hypothetical protein
LTAEVVPAGEAPVMMAAGRKMSTNRVPVVELTVALLAKVMHRGVLDMLKIQDITYQ